jgi:hypothetical protein
VHAASPCYTRLPVDGRAARRSDLARFPRWRNFSNPAFRGDTDHPDLSAECLNRPTHRRGGRLAPWRGDRHGTQRASWLRSWRSVAGGAYCDDHAALAASLSSARSRLSDVSCFVALRSMVCDSGRATIYACRGDLLRGAEPLGQQLAAIPRSFLGCGVRLSAASAARDRPTTSSALPRAGTTTRSFWPEAAVTPTRARLLMARLRHADGHRECPLVGEDRKWAAQGRSGAIDPFDGAPIRARMEKRPFRCRFTIKREFVDVMSMTNEGKL